MRIVFLVSGNGGNLKFFFKACSALEIRDIELFVIADRVCGAVEFAATMGLYHHIIRYSKSEPSALVAALKAVSPDLIVTNWHKIIDQGTVECYAGRMVNLHYSLLPSYAGLLGIEPLCQAFTRGCGYVGATTHLVDAGVDTGKIIGQTIVNASVGLDRAVELVFQQGAVLLLDTLLKLSGKASNANLALSRTEFSPPLSIDPAAFDEVFWRSVAQA